MRLELDLESIAPIAVLDENTEFSSEQSDDPADLLKHGIAAAQKGDRETARELLTHAVDLDPASEDAWMWLASISDYPEELLAFLNKVLAINPDNKRAAEWHAATRSLLAKTFVQRGIAAHDEGAAELANSCFEQALAHDDECAVAWFWKAGIASSDEQKIEYLERALALNPENDAAQNALASLRPPAHHATLEEAKWAAVAGKRKKALEILGEVLANAPANAEAWILRSHLSTGLDYKIHSLEKALESEPDNQSARASYEFLTMTVHGARPANDQPADLDRHTEPVQETAQEPAVESGIELLDANIDETDTDAPAGFETYVDPAAPEKYETVDTAEILIDAEETDEQLLALCAFCESSVDSQAFECGNCHAVLSLSDLESLLANTDADSDMIQPAVTRMEADWNQREFDVHELSVLGIGHLNLRSFESGFKYLQEASRLDPNDVILAGQVNSLAIRLDEMRRQDEVDESKPRGKSILVVDDSPTVRKLISAKLEKSGHNVTCAADGVEGLEKLSQNGGFDLVLLDIAMPRMDGYDVCKQIRTNPAAAELPVVMISGKDGFFDKVRGKMAGCTGYVTKPFGPETLMKALETYLLPENGLAE